jgi:hypothetical protein
MKVGCGQMAEESGRDFTSSTILEVKNAILNLIHSNFSLNALEN